ncbi:hypothetical protein BURC_02906 [Burkholderiaceae bacterium]|nr:hypothetical protein BURC_02906 [Burkholderiaceae bacterium]
MDFDDIVIGSGLAALGAVLGLEHSPRVLVLCGPAQGSFSYYDERGTVPCAYHGEGGLGNDWHGVIPTGGRNNFAQASDDEFAAAFARFYPRTPILQRLGSASLFVPWRPIRPREQLRQLARQRGARLTLLQQPAAGFSWNDRFAEVTTATQTFRARRVWLAAGALHTPGLLERSLRRGLRRPMVSDHAFCYLGHTDELAPPRIVHSREGMVFPAMYGSSPAALYTARPARFGFRELDFGIEQRAVFGLPTGNAVMKLARRMSPGLLAEAFYNRFGVFSAAPRYSVYAQVVVPDAYSWHDDPDLSLRARVQAIGVATDEARGNPPFRGLCRSRRPEVYIPGIHLHHSVDLAALKAAGVNEPGAALQVVDASVLTDIGPDHHSFKMLLGAMLRARDAVEADQSSHRPERAAAS